MLSIIAPFLLSARVVDQVVSSSTQTDNNHQIEYPTMPGGTWSPPVGGNISNAQNIDGAWTTLMQAQRTNGNAHSEHVGNGPYVLIISEVNGGMTKFKYRSGAACLHARNEARRQIGGVRLQALCIPQ